MTGALAYLPELYPDESFYSYFARYRADLGLPQYKACEDFFGGFVGVSPSGLQTNLAAVVRRLRNSRLPTVSKAIHVTTSFNYYAAFSSPARTAEVRDHLADGGVGSVALKLGLGGMSIRPPLFLRFCTECYREMEAEFAVAYWRRSHQLPSVFVCPIHANVLMNSQVATSGRGVFNTAPAEGAEAVSPAIQGELGERAHELLLDLARRSAKLLNQPAVPIPHVDRATNYRARLRELHFVTGDLIASDDLTRHYQAFLSPLAIEPGVPTQLYTHGASPIFWQNSDHAIHPARHLLFGMFLDSCKGARPNFVDPKTPEFGGGPWACPNPLADHHGQLVVEDFSLVGPHADGQVYARHACKVCGFVGDVALTDGKLKRVLNRGKWFPHRIRELASSLTPYAIARELGTERRVIISCADREGISLVVRRLPKSSQPAKRRTVEDLRRAWLELRDAHPTDTRTKLKMRKHRLVKRLRLEDPNWFEANLPPKLSRQGEDTSTRDIALRNSVIAEAEKMRRALPPQRVSARQLTIKLADENLRRHAHRSRKYPETIAALKEVDEPIESFQLRRAHWAITQLLEEGRPIRSSYVRTKAGLQTRHNHIAAKAISEWQAGG